VSGKSICSARSEVNFLYALPCVNEAEGSAKDSYVMTVQGQCSNALFVQEFAWDRIATYQRESRFLLMPVSNICEFPHTDVHGNSRRHHSD